MLNGSERNTRLVEFFRAIWPSTGWYCIAVKTPRGMHHEFFQTTEDAAAFALAADDRGLEVYHACASYQERGSRKAANVHRVKAFWMDIDVGPGKGYADARLAYEAVGRFCVDAGLPSPGYVFSGGGWHLYWPLAEDVTIDVWKAMADRLKQLCGQRGLAADPVRTADAASILRPPGTHNRKREPVEVRYVPGRQHDIAVFEHALGQTFVQPNAVSNDKFQVSYTGPQEPAYGEHIANQCGQLRNFRDRRGQLPEPEWYAGLCVLAHCADGERLAHEWSSGDERYSYNGTQRKLEHGRKDGGPTTCTRFQGLNATPCMGCPHFGRITSPIQLGRPTGPETARPVSEPAGDAGGTDETRSGDLDRDGTQPVRLPPLKWPYRYAANHAIEVIEAEGENNQPIWGLLYKAPIFVSHVRRHELQGGITIALQHWLPHEGWQEALLPWDDHSQKVVLNRLGSQGVNVHGPNAKHMLGFLHMAIDDYQANGKVDMEYAQFGWKGDFEAFLLGHELFEPGKPPRMVGVTPELAMKAQGLRAYGTFENWRAAANQLFAFERQGLMVLAGFAAVLMKFAQEAGGIILAAVSEEGGKGKTLGLRGAQTIWGSEDVTAVKKTDTANARVKQISLLGGLPVTWDEMRDRDPEVVKDFVLTFSGGRDKNRLDKSSALRQVAQSWSTMLIATSNISVAELVSHDGETAQQARILEAVFEDLAGVKASDGKEIERTLLANRGHAGRRFIQALMYPGMVDWLRHAVPTYAREYERELGQHNTVLRFYTNGLACLRAAAEIVTRAQILEFDIKRVMDYAVNLSAGMKDKLSDPRNDHVGVLNAFINQNWRNALVVQDAWKPRTETMPQQIPHGGLHIRYERATSKVYIDRAFIKDWCMRKRVMFDHLRKRLMEAGLLVNYNKKINLGAGTTFAAGGQVTTWEIRAIADMGVDIPVDTGDNVVRIK